MEVAKEYNVKVYHKNLTFTVTNINQTEVLTRTVFDVYDEGKEEWIILKDFYVWSHRIQKVIKIERWSITDLASIPAFARPIISVNEEHRYGAVVHDMLYKIDDFDYDRKTCDLILRDVSKSQGLGIIKSEIMYRAVRLGGWLYFRKPKRPIYLPEKLMEKYKRSHRELFLSRDIQENNEGD